MPAFTCPRCQKEWPETYCPECARTIGQRAEDDLVIEGDIIGDSFATCPAKTPLNPLRYLWYKSDLQFFLQIWAVLAAAVSLACFLKWWIVGGILTVLLLALSYLLWWICRRNAEFYQNAALTAGLVVSQQPLEFISLADMDAGFGISARAVKRVAIARLPCHPDAVGSTFPCVSTFQEGPDLHHWSNFDPQPLSFGTGDVALIQARRDKLGEAAFEELKKTFAAGKYPPQAGQLLWLDEVKDRKTPPPLPNT